MSIVIERRNIDRKAIDTLSGLSPLLARIYSSRGIEHADQLKNGLDRLLSPHQLKGVEAAVARLIKALSQQQRILVVADFDADGATSTALCILSLRLYVSAYCITSWTRSQKGKHFMSQFFF